MPGYDSARATWFAATGRRPQEKAPAVGSAGLLRGEAPGLVGLQRDAVLLEDGGDRAILLQLGQGTAQGGGKVG